MASNAMMLIADEAMPDPSGTVLAVGAQGAFPPSFKQRPSFTDPDVSARATARIEPSLKVLAAGVPR